MTVAEMLELAKVLGGKLDVGAEAVRLAHAVIELLSSPRVNNVTAVGHPAGRISVLIDDDAPYANVDAAEARGLAIDLIRAADGRKEGK
jgi:hypothetical protein